MFSASRTWLLRIWQLSLCWPFWKLFSLAFTLKSAGLMISAEAELSSSSGLRHFAWRWIHTFDHWDSARTQHRSALVAMKFKIQKDIQLSYVLSSALDDSKLCDPDEGISMFLSLSRICVTWGRPQTSIWTSHVPSQDLFSNIFNLCKKKAIEVLVETQEDSDHYMGGMHYSH